MPSESEKDERYVRGELRLDEIDKNITKQIREKAYEIIKERPSGIRFSELVSIIRDENPNFNISTINAQVSYLRKHEDYKDKLSQAPKIYKAIKYETDPNFLGKTAAESKKKQTKYDEKDFYESFANFLADDLRECSKVRTLGNSKFMHKWSTPDVVGYYSVERGAAYPKDPEIVAGELKTKKEYKDLITAFGQAVSYLLFSHKSYIAVPEDSDPEGREALETLCSSFGIGLLFFDDKDSSRGDFKIRHRARRHEPNIVYFNDFGVKIIRYIEKGK